MEWFGKSWAAKVCTPDKHIATPVGEACFFCGHRFRRGDRGLAFPHIYKDRMIAHATCFLRAIGRYEAAERIEVLAQLRMI